MENSIESRPATKVQEGFLPMESISETHLTDGASCRYDVDANNTEIISTKYELKEEEQNFVMPIFKISVNKALIPLRITLFLWYGVGKVTASYLTVFMKQKGLSLVEYSSVFSVAFIFQFLTVFASGIIADKLGNAKPVLMTHMVINLICILAFLLSPQVDSDSGVMETTISKNRSEELMKIFQKCEELNLHRSQVDKTGNQNLKSENYSEAILREIFENCGDMNGTTNFESGDTTPAFGNPVLNTITFDADHSNDTILPCRALNGNCTDPAPKNVHGRNVVFVYVILMIVFYSSFTSIYRFLDVTVMSFSNSHNINFGRERFFSMSGQILISFVTAIVLDQLTLKGEDKSYQSVYVLTACVLCLQIVAVYCIKAQIKPQSRHMWRDGFRFIRNKDVLAFILVVFLLGSSYGFIANFSVWFLEHLDAPTILLGLQQTFNALYGLPFLLTSKFLLRVFGTKRFLVTGFLGYIIYGVGYSYLYEPWWCLLIESASILSYHMLWIAVVVHSHSIAPESLVSTVIAIAGGYHYSLGISVGTLSYGLVLDAVGPRATFRIFAGMNLLLVVCYLLFLRTRKS